MNQYLLKSFLFSFLISSLHPSAKDLFIKYKNPIFVETGCFNGDGIQQAIDANFTQIYSIELADKYYNHCVMRFQTNKNVHLFLGDSSTLLSLVIEQIDEPITFWLDGHNSWGDTARGCVNTPILDELEAIKNHPIKTHTILIDDVRQFGTIHFDFIELQDIVNLLQEINPNYKLKFEDGFVANDVLVAYVPQ